MGSWNVFLVMPIAIDVVYFRRRMIQKNPTKLLLYHRKLVPQRTVCTNETIWIQPYCSIFSAKKETWRSVLKNLPGSCKICRPRSSNLSFRNSPKVKFCAVNTKKWGSEYELSRSRYHHRVGFRKNLTSVYSAWYDFVSLNFFAFFIIYIESFTAL